MSHKRQTDPSQAASSTPGQTKEDSPGDVPVHEERWRPVQPPWPQHGQHHVFCPGEDQQRQPPVQEGQGVLLHRKIQFKIRGDECQEIEPERNCKSQLFFKTVTMFIIFISVLSNPRYVEGCVTTDYCLRRIS